MVNDGKCGSIYGIHTWIRHGEWMMRTRFYPVFAPGDFPKKKTMSWPSTTQHLTAPFVDHQRKQKFEHWGHCLGRYLKNNLMSDGFRVFINLYYLYWFGVIRFGISFSPQEKKGHLKWHQPIATWTPRSRSNQAMWKATSNWLVPIPRTTGVVLTSFEGNTQFHKPQTWGWWLWHWLYRIHVGWLKSALICLGVAT